MFKGKGLYEWQLLDENKQVVKSGSQWNVITDEFLKVICWGNVRDFYNNYSTYWNTYPYYWLMSIQLSDTIPTPGVEYRRERSSAGFNLVNATPDLVPSYDSNSIFSSYTLGLPGVDTTYNVIGLRLNPGYFGYGTVDSSYTSNFVSFIKLSTPITQHTNEYLYVKYTLFMSYLGGGANGADNRFKNFFLQNFIMSGSGLAFGVNAYPRLTPLMPPDDINNMMRGCNSLTKLDYTSTLFNYKIGSRYSSLYTRNFSTSEFTGPIGCVTFINYAANGYSKTVDIAPSVSRVFPHTAVGMSNGDIFNDPTDVYLSRGTMAASGTPTNVRTAVIARVKISRTGDASNLTDETFHSGDVDPTPNNTIVVYQVDWAVDDIVHFATDGTLPGGLSISTDYYIVYFSGGKIKVSVSKGGSPVSLANGGSGNHTLIRWITGEYQLELTPYSPEFYYSLNGYWRLLHSGNIPMGIDANNKVMPYDLTGGDNGEGCPPYVPSPYGIANDFWTISMIRAQAQIGNSGYLWTVQESRYDKSYNMCIFKLSSLETSITYCKFSDSTTSPITRMVAGGTKLYISTTAGIYAYDTTTPAVPPALMSITGIINNVIRDICYDTVTGYLWTGHDTGLSRIDLGTNIATQYLNTAGGALDGLLAGDVAISSGELAAYNGRIGRGGYDVYGWVMDDGVGFMKGPVTYGGSINKGTNQYVYKDSGSTWYTYTVIVTGKGTGSWTLLQSVSSGSNLVAGSSQVCQIGEGVFTLMYMVGISGGQYRFSSDRYQVSNNYATQNPMSLYAGSLDGNYDAYYSYTQVQNMPWSWSIACNPINISDNLSISMFHWYFDIPYLTIPTTFGWNGSNWTTSSNSGKRITKNLVNLLDGITAQFNNATGLDWSQQFVATERYTFMYAPVKIKDNLQTMTMQARVYHCEAHVGADTSITIPALPYSHDISERSDPNFRDMDNIDLTTVVKEGATRYTQYDPTSTRLSVTFDTVTDKVTIASNIPTGTPVVVLLDQIGTYPWYYTPWEYAPIPTYPWGVYYAINVDSSNIRLATTYANALSNIYIDITYTGYLVYVARLDSIPTQYYYAGTTGVFVFSSVDTGKSITLEYTPTFFS